MGGVGSGRRQHGKSTTGDRWPLDIRCLHRAGVLTPGRIFGWKWTIHGREVFSIQARSDAERLTLNYRIRSFGGEWRSMNYPVYLEWTNCTLGGRRPWFLCPANGCGQRVAVLFGNSISACRHCQKLVYECQRETDDDRAARRADTIRRRLGWGAGIANPEGRKPKGMHWRTFVRLKAEYAAFANVAWTGMAERLGLLNRRLPGLRDDLNRGC